MVNNQPVVVLHDDSDSEHVRVVTIPCDVCRQTFAYRFVGAFREDALLPIDRVCRQCFPAWYLSWSRQNGWA